MRPNDVDLLLFLHDFLISVIEALVAIYALLLWRRLRTKYALLMLIGAGMNSAVLAINFIIYAELRGPWGALDFFPLNSGAFLWLWSGPLPFGMLASLAGAVLFLIGFAMMARLSIPKAD